MIHHQNHSQGPQWSWMVSLERWTIIIHIIDKMFTRKTYFSLPLFGLPSRPFISPVFAKHLRLPGQACVSCGHTFPCFCRVIPTSCSADWCFRPCRPSARNNPPRHRPSPSPPPRWRYSPSLPSPTEDPWIVWQWRRLSVSIENKNQIMNEEKIRSKTRRIWPGHWVCVMQTNDAPSTGAKKAITLNLNCKDNKNFMSIASRCYIRM